MKIALVFFMLLVAYLLSLYFAQSEKTEDSKTEVSDSPLTNVYSKEMSFDETIILTLEAYSLTITPNNVTDIYIKLPQNDFDLKEEHIFIQAIKDKSSNLIKENMLINLYNTHVRPHKFKRRSMTRFIGKKNL
ncbi:hypothetical protein ILUMI_03546 [Ignelater luminosus]|uniref:Uncharacterized protein n=1 Tax=Ignelater luminosus TaxID=2038154 RepID=A0A8K0DEC2_IGNLU|nr:hypothetical protein ILUMI_03546 [Ignelater luminosus]